MKKKLVKGILGTLGAVALLAGGFVSFHAMKNLKAMNQAADTFLDKVQKHYEVTEVDCGEYTDMTVNGIMKFHVKQYQVGKIGNLSEMTVNLGIMQMVTMVLTPAERDIPLVSMDYMYILGNRKCYLEFYDLVLDKEGGYDELLAELGMIREKYEDLENVTPSAAWYDALKTEGIYKAGKNKHDEEFNQIVADSLDAIMNYADTLPLLTEEERAEKKELQKTYSNGLIENGGISTDVFTKSLGAEKTREFFDRVLFKAE